MTERDRVVRTEDDPWNPDPSKKYSPEELETLASKILYEDRAKTKEEIGEVAQKILIYLLANGDGFPAEIAGAMAVNETSVTNNLEPMMEKGWIEFSYTEGATQYYKIAIGADLPEGLNSPVWLNEADLRYRKAAEIYSQTGQIDPSIEKGMFERSHPKGRIYDTDRTNRELTDLPQSDGEDSPAYCSGGD